VAESGAGWAVRCGGGGAAASPVGGLSRAVAAAAPRVRGGGCRGERRRLEIDEVGAAVGPAAASGVAKRRGDGRGWRGGARG
jgi:hypothetical protein